MRGVVRQRQHDRHDDQERIDGDDDPLDAADHRAVALHPLADLREAARLRCGDHTHAARPAGTAGRRLARFISSHTTAQYTA
jgi:hypothetical protein